MTQHRTDHRQQLDPLIDLEAEHAVVDALLQLRGSDLNLFASDWRDVDGTRAWAVSPGLCPPSVMRAADSVDASDFIDPAARSVLGWLGTRRDADLDDLAQHLAQATPPIDLRSWWKLPAGTGVPAALPTLVRRLKEATERRRLWRLLEDARAQLAEGAPLETVAAVIRRAA